MKIKIGVPYTRAARCVAGFIVLYAGIMIGCAFIILLISGANHLDRDGLIGMLIGGAIPIAYVTYLMFPASLVLEGLQNKPLNSASDMVLASINTVSATRYGSARGWPYRHGVDMKKAANIVRFFGRPPTSYPLLWLINMKVLGSPFWFPVLDAMLVYVYVESSGSDFRLVGPHKVLRRLSGAMDLTSSGTERHYNTRRSDR